MYDHPPAPTPAELPTKWVRISHKDPAHIAERYLYAGYGSNLDLGQMSKRCPGADIVGPGVLPGARLAFAGVATIIEDSRSTCLMGVYRMTAVDVAEMDRFEGLGRAYERYLVTIEMGETKVRCFTYVKKDSKPWAPNKAYYDRIRAGYKTWGFDEQRVYRAARRAQDEEKPWNRPTRCPAPKRHNFDTGHYPWEPLSTGPIPLPHEDDAWSRGEEPDRRIRIDERMSAPDFIRAVRANQRARQASLPFEYMTDQERTAFAGSFGQVYYVNPKTGERWRKGDDKVWRRAKD